MAPSCVPAINNGISGIGKAGSDFFISTPTSDLLTGLLSLGFELGDVEQPKSSNVSIVKVNNM